MLLVNRDLLLDDPFAFVVLLVAVSVSLLIGITVHEFSHAWAANRLGDMTATNLGRLTLNPKAHLDPTGTLMLLIAGFGWGRPVPVDPRRLRNGRRGVAIVSAAGPLSNVALALGFALLFQLGLVTQGDFSREALRTLDPLAWATIVATYSVLLNLILAAFNVLPIAPLDGGGILLGIVPRPWLPAIARIQRYGPFVLVGVIGFSLLTGVRVLGFLFEPVLDLADRLMS